MRGTHLYLPDEAFIEIGFWKKTTYGTTYKPWHEICFVVQTYIRDLLRIPQSEVTEQRE
jgi:hypothetical protein